MYKDFEESLDFRHRMYCYKCGIQGHDGDFEWSTEYRAYVCEKHLYEPTTIRDQYEVNLDESDYLPWTTVQRVKPEHSKVWGSEPGVKWGYESGVKW